MVLGSLVAYCFIGWFKGSVLYTIFGVVRGLRFGGVGVVLGL